MRYPNLIKNCFCKTDLKVTLESATVTEDGQEGVALEWTGKCNYQENAHKVYTSEKIWVDVNGTCLIPGDIFSGLSKITGGKVIIFGEEREIIVGAKHRNPDETVNYTSLEVK